MKQQQRYIKKQKNKKTTKPTKKQQPTKPKGKTNKRLKICPFSTISCIVTTYIEDQ